MSHNIIWQTYQNLISTLLPNFCSYCRTLLQDNAIFCPDCFAKIEPIASKTIAVTSKQQLTVFAAAVYQTPLKELILAKASSHEHASRNLARLIVAMTPVATMHFDFIVPVPLHWTRRLWRGYNQAAIMAQVIAKACNSTFLDCLQRTKKTPFLSTVHAEERSILMLDALHLKSNYLKENFAGKSILLVDDLMTTGSTLKAAAKVLLPFKPSSLHAVVACRTK